MIIKPKMLKKKKRNQMPKIETKTNFQRWLAKPFWNKVRSFVSTIEYNGQEEPIIIEKTIHEWDVYEDKRSYDRRGYSVTTFIEEGNEIGIGYHNEWKMIISRKEFNKIVLKYIWIWVRYEWFGLRTWLYWHASKQIWKRADKIKKQQTKNER